MKLTRQERRDIRDEELQAHLDKIKEENEMASFYDMLDAEEERKEFRQYLEEIEMEDQEQRRLLVDDDYSYEYLNDRFSYHYDLLD